MPSKKMNAANLYGGGAAPLQFTHTQTVPAAAWVVDHNFGVPGSLRAVAYDANGVWMPHVGIQVASENRAVVSFAGACVGRVDVFADDAYEFAAIKVASQIDLGGAELTPGANGHILLGGSRIITERDLGNNGGLAPLFSDIRNKPTTLAGYGITDGIPSLTQAAPELAWRDITSEMFARTSGSAAPSLSLFRGMLYTWQFLPSTLQSLYATFHMPHDYAPGTPIYIHVHWSEAAPDGGKVRWGFEYSIAKGHGQEAFPNTSITYVEQTCGGAYYHMVAETGAISSRSLEPDALILVRIFRDAPHANDTSGQGAFAFTCHIHYQADRHGTLNRAPNFYA